MRAIVCLSQLTQTSGNIINDVKTAEISKCPKWQLLVEAEAQLELRTGHSPAIVARCKREERITSQNSPANLTAAMKTHNYLLWLLNS